MVQALRSFKVLNKLRKCLEGKQQIDASRTHVDSITHKKLGAPIWAQIICFISVTAVLTFASYQLFIAGYDARDVFRSRRLRNDMCAVVDDDEEADCESGASHPAYVILYLLGVFYIFSGIAIVCDEFFVPSLEQIGIFLDLSDDVSGATLMAAGGSAPELATSLIGTFSGSDVGFGTIVGSAVFNVLFVIACCVMSTPKELAPLRLTGWPLARDCCYYSLTLIVVAIFFGGTSPGIIEGWEAGILFGLYLLYVLLMKYNDKLYLLFNPPADITPDSTPSLPIIEKNMESFEQKDSTTYRIEESDSIITETPLHFSKKSNSAGVLFHSLSARSRKLVNRVAGGEQKSQSVNVHPSHVRAGLFHLIFQEAITDTTGVDIVNKIKLDVRECFDLLDKDRSGLIDIHELKELMAMLSHGTTTAEDISEDAVLSVMKALDLDKSGSLDFAEFTVWYVESEERLQNELHIAWSKIDKDQSGIRLSHLQALFNDLNLQMSDDRLQDITTHFLASKLQIESPTKEWSKSGKEDNQSAQIKISFQEFSDWYNSSEFHESKAREAKCAAASAEGIWGDIYEFPKQNLRGNIIYVLLFPLSITLACTCGIKDVRVPGNEKWAYFEFFASIFWIGLYSFVLVDWVTVIGLTLKIPIYVLGLTLLAGGTSVPDLLSSVVVAKAGKGDMAVSSSIGSNIFDVTVGLPVPWILFNFVYDCPVIVGADNLVISIAILLAMVIFVIVAIVASGWAMDFKLGATMMILYVFFLVQDISRIYLSGNVGC